MLHVYTPSQEFDDPAKAFSYMVWKTTQEAKKGVSELDMGRISNMTPIYYQVNGQPEDANGILAHLLFVLKDEQGRLFSLPFAVDELTADDAIEGKCPEKLWILHLGLMQIPKLQILKDEWEKYERMFFLAQDSYPGDFESFVKVLSQEKGYENAASVLQNRWY